MPAGISTLTRWRSGARPWPSQSGQGLSILVPVPPQSGQVVRVCICPRKVRCVVTTWPLPWQVGHWTFVPPSAQPLPWQVSQGARRL